MNLQIACVVNGNTEYIELFGNEAFTMDISFAEIQDVTKKNSAYSKELNVPGSKQNNYIFNYFFDLNQVPLNFTPTKKFEASVLYNGYVIASGYIRLNNVVVTGIEKTYNITFYNGVGDVAAQIGDKFMAQLDLSHLDHPFTDNVYLQSTLDPNLFPMTGTTNYSYQNGKTFWGLFNIGYNYVNSLSAITSYYTTTSTTSISISSGQKTIITAASKPFIPGDTIRMTNAGTGYWIQGIVDSINGTTIVFTPNLGLGTGTYSSWNISRELAEGAVVNDPVTTPLLEFQAQNVPNYMSFSGTPVRQYYFKPSIQIKELYEQIFKQAGYNIESNFFQTSYFEKYYLPLKFLDETIYTRGSVQPCFSYSGNDTNFTGTLVNPLGIITCNNIPFTATTTGFIIPAGYEGVYTFQINAKASGDIQANDTGILQANIIVNGSATQIINEYVFAPSFGGQTGPFTFDTTVPVTVNVSGATTISLEILTFGVAALDSFTFEILYSPRFIIGNFNYSNEFPPNDFKQIDFITSINKYFNLVCIPSTTIPNTLVIEPIIDYIGKGKILDWSEKIDWDSPITVSPTTNILNGTLLFNFKLDQDYANQQFNIANNRIFGTYELQLNQDYKDNKIEFNTIFGSPVDTGLNNSNLPAITISNMATIKTQENKGVSLQKLNPYKILPRVIFRGPVLPNENWSQINLTGNTTQYWWAEQDRIDRWQETNRFTTYPFSYTGFSHYINYNAQDFFDPLESQFTSQQDMYDIYYYDYISDIISPENKIISAKIYLTPYEIANLEFNEKIIVKNAYFRVNKISGYNLTEPSLCNIELIKLTKNYTPHPVQYYDLINCNSGGTDYHTTSDLNYNMYAYVGNYVNIYTGSSTNYNSIGCFQVQLGEPNSTYDYEKVFIASGYTSAGVSVYDNCGCTGRTQMIVVQQQYPEPTPPPVTSPTPTPSPTGTPSVTPTMTPTMTMTMTQTMTMTPSPTPSEAGGDPDANAYLEAVVQAGGTGITSTVSAATQTMFVDLKNAGLYTKLNALYPFLGGNAPACKYNALNPVDSDAAFRLTFFGGGTFSQEKGYKGNGSNAYGNTYWIQNAETTTGNTSIGVFISISGTAADGFDIGSLTSSSWLAFDTSRTGNFRGNIEAGLANFTAQTTSQAINFNALSRSSNSTVLFVARGGGVQSFSTTGTATLQNVATTIGQANTFGSYSDRGFGTAFIGDGLTSGELGDLRDIITTFNTTLGRNI
jgi:hypothetical protein